MANDTHPWSDGAVRVTLVLFLSFACALLASALGHQLYVHLIVPRLGYVTSVPMWWWVGSEGPIAVAVVGIGLSLRRTSELAMSSLASAAGIVTFGAWATSRYEPGYRKSPLGEDLEQTLINVVLTAAVCFVVQAVTSFLFNRARRRAG